MIKQKPIIAVFGCMSTNELIYVDSIIGPNQVRYTNDTSYVAGGKALNIACMIRTLLPSSPIFFASKTAKDVHGLWKYPYRLLKKLKINTDHIVVPTDTTLQPNRVIAQIERSTGNKAYIVIPGITDTYSPDDIESQKKIFPPIVTSGGLVVVTFEIPPQTVLRILKMATNNSLPLFVDMGGVLPNFPMKKLFEYPIYLLKPNRYETKVLTGIDVCDDKTARAAGKKLLQGRIQNVLVTVGAHGAYLINKNQTTHIPAPVLRPQSTVRNAVGCGDQVMATLCSQYLEGNATLEAAKKSIVAGTLQLYKQGIIPVTQAELRISLT